MREERSEAMSPQGPLRRRYLDVHFGIVSLLDGLNLSHSEKQDSAVDFDILSVFGGQASAVGKIVVLLRRLDSSHHAEMVEKSRFY